MADIGVKVAIRGNSALSADKLQFVFHSGNLSPKIALGQSPAHFKTETYTFASDPGVGVLNLFTIAHGYGRRVEAIVYVYDQTDNVYALLSYYMADLGPAMKYRVTDNNLIIDFERFFTGTRNVNGQTFLFKYYIFAEAGA